MEMTTEKHINLDLFSIPNSRIKEAKPNKNEEEIVICDECGDTLWDKVLAQEEAKNNQKNRRYGKELC